MLENSFSQLAHQRPCVGRSQELATLAHRYELALEGESAVCCIRGGAGSGKSTLLRAFASSLDLLNQQTVIAWGHCDHQVGSISPLAPWTEILQSFSGLSDIGIAAEQFQDKSGVAQTLSSAFTELAPDLIELLIPGFGLAMRSAKLIRNSSLGERLKSSYARPEEVAVDADRSRLQDQYVAIVERVLEKAPLLIILDDIDCSDEASLQLMTRMVERTRGRPILFLTAMRSEPDHPSLDASVAKIGKSVPVIDIDLDIARIQRGSELVEEYVQQTVPGVNAEFINNLSRHTGGHPQFVVELIAHLQSAGSLVNAKGHWQASPDLGWDEVPAEIGNVLSTQLSGLDSELLDVLQAGSVEGDQFCIEVVAAVLEKSPLSVARLLSRQAPGNLVEAVGSQLLGPQKVTLFRFSHSLGHQHVYASIPALERTYLHEAVGTQLEALAGDSKGPLAAQLAYQFEHGNSNEKACLYYSLAATHAISTCSLVEATTHLERALVLNEHRLEEMKIKHQLAKLAVMTGDLQHGVEMYQQAGTIAREEDAGELIGILADQAYAHARLNEPDAAEDLAILAVDLAHARAEDSGLLTAMETLASVQSKRGGHSKALDYQMQALELAQTMGNESLLAGCLTRYGWYCKELGRYDEAEKSLKRSLEMQEKGVPNYSQLAGTHNAMADMYINREDYDEARKHMLLAVECWQRFDRSADVAVGLSNLANLTNREGLYEEALDYGQRAYDADLEVYGKDHPDLAFSLTCIGESQIGLRLYPAAIKSLGFAYELRVKHNAPESNIAWTQWLLGRALVESGEDPVSGWQYVKKSRELFVSMGAATRSEAGDIDNWLASQPAVPGDIPHHARGQEES